MMKNYLILDVETTTHGKGDWANKDNRLCLVGLQDAYGSLICDVEYTIHPYNEVLEQIQSEISNHDIIVGFNLKFDLHWLRNYGIDFSKKELYDIQNAEFIFSGQQWVYPDLNGTSQRYGLGSKIDTIATEYWEKGIDTPDIPYEELSEYLKQDLVLTERAYQIHQKLTIPDTTRELIKLVNEDLHVIIDMEHNGICYDERMAEEERKLYQQELNSIHNKLGSIYPDYPWINWSSNDHVSVILFGGTITWIERCENGVYVSGKKIGLPKYKLVRHEVKFPRLAEPAKGTEVKKEGYWSVSEEALETVKKATKTAKLIIKLLGREAKLQKLIGTYYSKGEDKGLLTLRKRKNWQKNRIFGKYDQCVAQTGRLASNSPNMQNFPEEVDRLIYSRFEEQPQPIEIGWNPKGKAFLEMYNRIYT